MVWLSEHAHVILLFLNAWFTYGLMDLSWIDIADPVVTHVLKKKVGEGGDDPYDLDLKYHVITLQQMKQMFDHVPLLQPCVMEFIGLTTTMVILTFLTFIGRRLATTYYPIFIANIIAHFLIFVAGVWLAIRLGTKVSDFQLVLEPSFPSQKVTMNAPISMIGLILTLSIILMFLSCVRPNKSKTSPGDETTIPLKF